MKCDELQQVENPIEWGLYYDKNEVDAAIDELKREHHRERHEYIEMVAQLKAKLVEQESDKRELKSFIVLYDGKFIRAYNKSEADKVIAELEESHKKEIGQLFIEIVKLKDSIGKLLKAKTEQVMDEVLQKSLVYGEGFVPVEHAMRLVAELRRQKYKRCLTMAEKCESMCYWFAARFDHHELVDNVKWELFDRWRLRWAKLADKFKEAK